MTCCGFAALEISCFGNYAAPLSTDSKTNQQLHSHLDAEILQYRLPSLVQNIVQAVTFRIKFSKVNERRFCHKFETCLLTWWIVCGLKLLFISNVMWRPTTKRTANKIEEKERRRSKYKNKNKKAINSARHVTAWCDYIFRYGLLSRKSTLHILDYIRFIIIIA